MKQIKIESTAQYHEDYSAFNETEQLLFAKAKEACLKAYAPYSKFHVGATILLADGTMVNGNNQENAAYPSGLCAERVAIFNASANYPDQKIEAVAITIDYDKSELNELVFPCGGCRQVILEYEQKFESDIKIYMLGKEQQVCVIDTIKQLLPFAFSGKMLNS